MDLLLIGLGILVVGGTMALVASSARHLSHGFGAMTAVIGSVVALVPAVRTVSSGVTTSMPPVPWHVPYGSFSIALDPLSAWFAIPILGLSAIAAMYGWQYLLHHIKRKALGVSWFFFNLLVASMVLVVIARNGILFLFAWEVMAITSYFLVVFEHEKKHVREAGWTYLVASHLGTAFLLVFFVLLGHEAGSLEFNEIRRWIEVSGGFTPQISNVLFLLAVIGFGTKAGFVPLHVWLPEAHPVAPSHVSAVMSGVMIKTGIYGMMLALTFLGPPPFWWAWMLIGIGMTSGVLGVLYALAQHDLKRLLAYHSVENIGIIALGFGTGLLGLSLNEPVIAVLGFAGSLLHVLNHAVFKGLLFLSAGVVIHSTGTGEMDLQGGLAKHMPVTAATFLVGAVAISGLPPLNGFISEFLIYTGALTQEKMSGPFGGVPALALIGSLALIGGLAAACFTKAFGVVFLGEPRTDVARNAHEAGWMMKTSMIALAACCVLIALFAHPIVHSLAPVIQVLAKQPGDVFVGHIDATLDPLSSIAAAFAVVLALAVLLALLRKWLLTGRDVESGPTWGCGFAHVSARMQYTSSSYAQPLTDFFAPLLGTHKKQHDPLGLFPSTGSLHTHTPDAATERLYRPLFRFVRWGVSKLGWIQHGHLNLYVMYIALTIVILLVWFLGIPRQ